MVDTGVVGCSWIQLPAGKYSLRNQSETCPGTGMDPRSGFTLIGGGVASGGKPHPPLTRCQLEVDVSYEEFISHTPEGEWQVRPEKPVIKFPFLWKKELSWVRLSCLICLVTLLSDTCKM